MARALALAFALALVVAVGTPVAAATSDEAAVRAHMAQLASDAARNDADLARLDRSMADRERRIGQERAELSALARILYEQPDNPLIAAAASPNLGAAVTRVTDLLVAADRARMAKAALDRDVETLVAEQTQALAARDRIAAARRDLDAEYQRLLVLDAATAALATAPAPTLTGAIPDVIRQAWSPLGAARADWAVRLAQCESGLNPYAVNRSSGAAGLFQFLPSTWAGTPWHAQSPFDAAANAEAAAWLYSRYGSGQWQCTARIGG